MGPSQIRPGLWLGTQTELPVPFRKGRSKRDCWNTVLPCFPLLMCLGFGPILAPKLLTKPRKWMLAPKMLCAFPFLRGHPISQTSALWRIHVKIQSLGISISNLLEFMTPKICSEERHVRGIACKHAVSGIWVPWDTLFCKCLLGGWGHCTTNFHWSSQPLTELFAQRPPKNGCNIIVAASDAKPTLSKGGLDHCTHYLLAGQVHAIDMRPPPKKINRQENLRGRETDHVMSRDRPPCPDLAV